MKTQHNTAVIIGVLFLIALIPNVIANEILLPILSGNHYWEQLRVHRTEIGLANMLNIICGIAMLLIPVFLYRKLNSYKELGIAYIVFRAIEAVLFFLIAIKTFSLTDLGGLGRNEIPPGVSMIQSELQWANLVYLMVYCAGAWVFYYMLCKLSLVPRWLALWGFLAVILLSAGPVMYVFGWGIFKDTPLLRGMAYFAPPIALNELVLAVWLIVKGFK